MPFRKWDPLQDLIMLHQDLFGEASDVNLTDQAVTGWTPALDIYETPEAFKLKVEIPGIDPEKIRLEFRESKVVISGDRPAPPPDQQLSYHLVERLYGPFERVITLPPYVCCQEITAEFKDGVLDITIPKGPPPSPKTIKVQG